MFSDTVRTMEMGHFSGRVNAPGVLDAHGLSPDLRACMVVRCAAHNQDIGYTEVDALGRIILGNLEKVAHHLKIATSLVPEARVESMCELFLRNCASGWTDHTLFLFCALAYVHARSQGKFGPVNPVLDLPF